ncbi:Thioredoxin-like protein AAED1, chloroplastic [Glycine max]|nr:Thioredoxin-like protein AAED1, chloroplastic [Glycine max]KAH1202416.1 Thioredoxin-like protein AAED1, chloroplastic [Glycine max]
MIVHLLIYALSALVLSWELASALKESKARFDSAGVKLIAVGIGTPNKARMLAERLPFPLDCLYADPDRKAYHVLNLYYGFGRTFFNPSSIKVFSRFDALQKAVKNYTIEATPDDRSGVLQQGGMFVFRGKQLLYARKDEGTGDHAPLDDVFDVCCKAPKRIRKLELQVDSMAVVKSILFPRLLMEVPLDRGFNNLANHAMATLQSLPPSFRPSIPPPNSHSFPATPFNYSPKLIASKGVSVTLRNSITSPRVSVSNSEYSPQIAENLGDVTIFTAAGEPVRFSDLWDQNQGVAVVAIWEFASALKESKARFDSAGIKLIAVGVGTPNKARILAERLPFPMDCLYADPDRKAYNVLNLYFGLGRTFLNPASAKVFSRWDALQKAAKNYTIGATPDDISGVLQQGGMFVFRGKQLLYARKDEGTGDHAPLDDVFDVCCKAPVA